MHMFVMHTECVTSHMTLATSRQLLATVQYSRYRRILYRTAFGSYTESDRCFDQDPTSSELRGGPLVRLRVTVGLNNNHKDLCWTAQ